MGNVADPPVPSSKTELPYMKVFVRDILAEAVTAGLAEGERGAYWSLLFALWVEGGALPNNAQRLRSIAGCDSAARWEKLWGAIADLFVVTDKEVRHARLSSSLDRDRKVLTARQEGASKTNEKRWGKRRGKFKVLDGDGGSSGGSP